MNYYEILGVPEKATSAEIVYAYRNKAYDNHPSKHPVEFELITTAYNVLKDSVLRAEYDVLIGLKTPVAVTPAASSVLPIPIPTSPVAAKTTLKEVLNPRDFTSVQMGPNRTRLVALFVFVVSTQYIAGLVQTVAGPKTPFYEPYFIALIPALILTLWFHSLWSWLVHRSIKRQIAAESYSPPVLSTDLLSVLLSRIFSLFTLKQWAIGLLVVVIAGVAIRSININRNIEWRIEHLCESVSVVDVSENRYTVVDGGEDLGYVIIYRLDIDGTNVESGLTGQFSFKGGNIQKIILVSAKFADGPISTNGRNCDKVLYQK